MPWPDTTAAPGAALTEGDWHPKRKGACLSLQGLHGDTPDLWGLHTLRIVGLYREALWLGLGMAGGGLTVGLLGRALSGGLGNAIQGWRGKGVALRVCSR